MPDHGAARREEARIKQLDRAAKLVLIDRAEVAIDVVAARI
jgi:predicted GIY-YIG superfamily endonuclease